MKETNIATASLPQQCRPAVKELLKEIYGYTDFRDFEVYNDLSSGKDKLKISQGQLIEEVIEESEKSMKTDSVYNFLLTAPTGAGKSLLFQLPAIYLGQEYKLLTIVISPLKALIVDQVENLRDLGYEKVSYASSDLSPEEKNEAYRQVREGETDLFYLSPELLLAYDIKHFIGDRRIGLIVVDEAHTVTTWGKEFRVDYWFLGRHLDNLKKNLGYAFPVFALTATAVWNPRGGNDMVFETIRSLRIDPCRLFVGTVKRENIGFDIRLLTIEEDENYDKAKQRVIIGRTDDFLDEHKTIMYYPFAGSIDTRIKMWVRSTNWRLVSSYYGKKDKAQKAAIVEAFKEGDKRMIIATKAFGMGIDKPDVRLVVHIDFPDSPEAYFQEAGRAGRDGQKSYAVLLYARSDKTLLNKRIADTFPEKEYIRQVYEHINYYYQMAMGDGLGCTYAFNIDEFCQNFKHFPIRVDSALKILTRAGYLEYTDEQDNASRLMFTLRRDELYRIQENNPDTENLIRIILRSYTGLFSDYAYINEETLALRSGLSRQQVYETLVLLTKRHILHYIPGKKTPYIIYTRERQESERIVLNREVYEDRKASYEQRIKAMLEYADAENKCRSRILLQYFGEKNEHNCGLCDACLAKHSSGLKHGEFEDIRNQIMDILQSPCSSHDLLEALPGDKEKNTKALSYLLAEEVIGQEHGKLYICK